MKKFFYLVITVWIFSHQLVYGHTKYSKSMDQPGKVANPARGQLNWENSYFPVPVRACEFGLARRFGSPVPPRQLAHLHTQAEYGAYLRGSSRVSWWRPFIQNRPTPSSQSRVYGVAQLRTDDVNCRESAGTGPVNLKVVLNGCWLGR